MKKRGWAIILACVVVLVCVCFVLSGQESRWGADIPSDVPDLIEEYMDTYKRGTEYSVEYMHFEDEFVRQAYIDTGNNLLDYQVESIEKVNDNLYAVTVQVKTANHVLMFGDSYEQVYNFVVRIDGKWYYVNGVTNIPPDLQENLDPSKYSYNDDNIVSHEDVFVIG